MCNDKRAFEVWKGLVKSGAENLRLKDRQHNPFSLVRLDSAVSLVPPIIFAEVKAKRDPLEEKKETKKEKKRKAVDTKMKPATKKTKT